MTFEEFQNKIKKSTNPDSAFKLYLQIKLSIIEEILVTNTNGFTREIWDRMEQGIFDKIIEKMDK